MARVGEGLACACARLQRGFGRCSSQCVSKEGPGSSAGAVAEGEGCTGAALTQEHGPGGCLEGREGLMLEGGSSCPA